MNLYTIRLRLYRLLGEDPTDPVMFSDAELNRYLNDSHREMARETRALDVITAVTTEEGEGTYTVPDEIGSIFRVAYDDYALFPDTTMRMDFLDQDWTSRTGTPERWFKDRQDERSFRIWPAPDTVTAGYDFDSEYGEAVYLSGSTFDSEYGVVIRATDDTEEIEFDSEYGVLIQGIDGDVEIWGTGVPLYLSSDTDELAVPRWAQMGVCFRAAELALLTNKESYNPQLAAAYGALARDYYDQLRDITTDKQPQRPKIVGRLAHYRPRYLRRETHITE